MNTLEIAHKLVELCRQGNMQEARTLYAADAVSVEAAVPPGGQREAHGLAAIQAKSEWWNSHHDIHSASVTGPWPHDDRFIIGFQLDVTIKASGQRVQLDECGLFTVKDGKVVREEFFYLTGG